MRDATDRTEHSVNFLSWRYLLRAMDIAWVKMASASLGGVVVGF
jgi:hypothetical protein